MNRIFGHANLATLLGAACVLAVTAGHAPAEDEFNRPGAYVGVGGSDLVEGFQGRTADGGFGNSLGLNARAGYRFDEFLATEGIYEYADDFGADAANGHGSIQTQTLTVNAKLLLPLGRFQPYLIGGVGGMYADAAKRIEHTGANADGWGFVGRFGSGVDVWATEHVSLYLEAAYLIPLERVKDLNEFTFGWGGRYSF